MENIKDIARQMHKNGSSLRQIAAKLNTTKSSVDRWLKETNGILEEESDKGFPRKGVALHEDESNKIDLYFWLGMIGVLAGIILWIFLFNQKGLLSRIGTP